MVSLVQTNRKAIVAFFYNGAQHVEPLADGLQKQKTISGATPVKLRNMKWRLQFAKDHKN